MFKEEYQHFILTRFNLLLWNKDKEGKKVRSVSWLEHRFSLFERYCLPSIITQTCQEFEWIVLFDSTTPKRYKNRIIDIQKRCPQLIPVFINPESGKYFVQIFRDEVVKRQKGNRTLTTYLDNDDALNLRFVEDIQRRVAALPNGTFVNYIDGYQYYTDYKYMMRIHYPRNHFMSVVEKADNAVRTIYGYGSHYYIEKIEGVRIENVKNQPMWCEVIHEKNMGNDAYFLNAKMVSDSEQLRRDFSLDGTLQSGIGIYLFRFLPRYFKTFVRRIGYKLYGRHW